MTTEDRLRRALRAAASTHEPSPDALDRIEEKLMDSSRFTSVQKWALGGLSAAAAIIVVVLLAATLGDDDGDSDLTTDTTSSTSTTSATTTTADTTTTSFALDVDPYQVVFPSPADSRRFDAPEAAVQAFATDVLGFTRLQVGAFRAGDLRSGEVPITDRDGGPETAVIVRQMVDDTWYVLGAQTADIEVDTPEAGAGLATPFATTGRALAFEGTVDVVVRALDRVTPLGSGFVTGSGTPPAGPFDGRIHFSPPPDDTAGLVVYRTLSAEDGHVERATVIRVRLTSESSTVPVEDCGDVADDTDSAQGRVVKVFFHCGTTDDTPVAVRRTIAEGDPAVLRRALEQLLAGPTDAEADAGFTSVFPVDGGELVGLVIDEGVATIDLSAAFADNLNNSSATTTRFTQEVVATAKQFTTVTSVRILFGGSCEVYGDWAQTGSCDVG